MELQQSDLQTMICILAVTIGILFGGVYRKFKIELNAWKT